MIAACVGAVARLMPALLLLLLAPPLAAQTPPGRSLAIQRFDADIVVRPDGSVDVTERIAARFTGSWNGIYRTIPVEYRNPQGFNWTLRLDDVRITDEAGRALQYEASRERHYLRYKIRVPGARDATRVVILRYRAENGLRFFPDHDELYWNVTGDEWDVPIEAAAARITLPPAATGLRATAFNGAYGATAQDAVVETESTTVRVTLPRPLGFHEGLTVVVGWNPGVVARPTATDEVVDFAESNWPLAIPAAVFLLMLALWSRVGRDPRRLPAPVQYEPPTGLTPAEAGTLVDESADMRDVTATMVDLAVRGHLRIEEREESALLGLMKRREYVFHRLEPADARPLLPHETQILGGIFSGGATQVRLSDLENEFYQHLPGVKERIFRRLVEQGLYRSRPDRVKHAWIGVGVFLGGAIALVGSSWGASQGLQPFPFLLAGLVSGLVVGLFARVMPARTVSGARALERLIGFEEFLNRVEKDRFERVVKTPELFERYLPYAMALGVERRWARAFRDIYREPPSWYIGTNVGTFDLDGFSGRLADLSSRASSVMTSSPRSSGGSGFSGGSSGGGSGGGGGGGW